MWYCVDLFRAKQDRTGIDCTVAMATLGGSGYSTHVPCPPAGVSYEQAGAGAVALDPGPMVFSVGFSHDVRVEAGACLSLVDVPWPCLSLRVFLNPTLYLQ